MHKSILVLLCLLDSDFMYDELMMCLEWAV